MTKTNTEVVESLHRYILEAYPSKRINKLFNEVLQAERQKREEMMREVLEKSIYKELMPGKYEADIVHLEDIKTIAEKYGIEINSDKK
jgi:hypothetical protein